MDATTIERQGNTTATAAIISYQLIMYHLHRWNLHSAMILAILAHEAADTGLSMGRNDMDVKLFSHLILEIRYEIYNSWLGFNCFGSCYC